MGLDIVVSSCLPTLEGHRSVYFTVPGDWVEGYYVNDDGEEMDFEEEDFELCIRMRTTDDAREIIRRFVLYDDCAGLRDFVDWLSYWVGLFATFDVAY